MGVSMGVSTRGAGLGDAHSNLGRVTVHRGAPLLLSGPLPPQPGTPPCWAPQPDGHLAPCSQVPGQDGQAAAECSSEEQDGALQWRWEVAGGREETRLQAEGLGPREGTADVSRVLQDRLSLR